ncbi:MAG TPA: hypothetical protein VFV10_20540 [Gammaproteobacteria bacterium]|nr:hypothetical protein [Gammaproteobacteria bacterium]
MKPALLSALVAAVVAAIVTGAVLKLAPPRAASAEAPAVDIDALAERLANHPALAGKAKPLMLSYTAEPSEDGWVDGSRGTAGADHRSLAPAASSICYLTKVEITGIRSPEDSNSCRIDVDDFTGYWQLTAEVGEGGKSQVRCNARCLVWQ